MMKKFKAKSNPETPKKTYSLRSKALKPSQTENIVTNESSQQVDSASGAVGWGVRFDVFSRKWRVTRDGRHGGDFEDLKQANKCSDKLAIQLWIAKGRPDSRPRLNFPATNYEVNTSQLKFQMQTISP